MVSKRICSRRFAAILPALVYFFAAAPRTYPAAHPPASSATLIYSKVRKGGFPEYVRITVDTNGEATYDGRKLSQPPRPRKMRLSPRVTRQLFSLAGKLGDFQTVDLASHRRVANLGLKTLEYQEGGATYKTVFNYTENHTGQKLVDLFEGISSVEQHIDTLEFSARYDPLGLPRQLTLVENDLENKVLVDPQLLAPILEHISKDSNYMHIAQERAHNLLEKIGAQ